jgi:rod shape-determining protein MreD
MKKIIQQILLAASLVAVQVLVFDNLQLRGVASTFVSLSVYFFYLLVLPVGTSQVYLLIVSFLLGLTTDVFSDTLGIHAASCVFVGFLRPHVLRLFIGSEEQNKHTIPSIRAMGAMPFFYYPLILAFCFHFVLCSLECFTFYKFYFTFLRIIVSSFTSAVMMMFYQALFVRKIK